MKMATLIVGFFVGVSFFLFFAAVGSKNKNWKKYFEFFCILSILFSCLYLLSGW